MAISYKIDALDGGARSPQSWAVIGDRLVISLTQSGLIPEPRWQRFLADLSGSQAPYVLGTSVGAVDVNSLQRKSVSDLLKGKRIAVVTDHRVARGIVTALGWLGLDIKSFNWASLTTAVDYLGIEDLETDAIVEVALELLRKSGAPTPEQM